jgi:hypothetical protein
MADPDIDLNQALHDLANPMAAAKGYLEIAIKHWDDLADDRRLEMVARSLLGINQLGFVLERLNARSIAGGDGRSKQARLGKRPELVAFEVDPTAEGSKARVTLRHSGSSLVGECDRRARVDHAVAALATVEALKPILDVPINVLNAGVLQIGDTPFAVVSAQREAEILVGSAAIEGDLNVAIARATLDAMNRFLAIEREDAAAR